MKLDGRLILPVVVFTIDQAFKYGLPTAVTTSHIPLFVRLAAFLVLLIVYIRLRHTWAALWLLVMTAAGASNVYDLVVFGSVRDIFVVQQLAFNVADVMLVGGMIILLLFSFKLRHYDTQQWLPFS